MSSAAAGKFQDHYKVLGIEPKSDSSVIQAAYSKLALLHHPRTGVSPDQEKFDALNLAFEVLSDPTLRSTFDSLRGGQEEAPVNFSGLSFFAAVKKEALIRNALMCLLYDYRRLKPRTPGISLRQIEPAILANYEELQLAIWYLKTKGYIIMDDKSRLEITVAGMDDMLKNLPEPQSVITMFKDINPDDEVPDNGPLAEDIPTASESTASRESTASSESPALPESPAPLEQAASPEIAQPAVMLQATTAEPPQLPAPSVQPPPSPAPVPPSISASLLSLSSASQSANEASSPTPAPIPPLPASQSIQTHPAEPLTLRLSTLIRRGPSSNG